MYSIDTAEVQTILLPDGNFHRVKYLSISEKEFSFRNEHGDTVSGPVSSILDATGPRVLTAEEIAEAEYLEEQRQRDAEALFLWRTYTDEETYLAALEEFCPNCGVLMAEQPITHFYQGRVLCRACSPLIPRFGVPY